MLPFEVVVSLTSQCVRVQINHSSRIKTGGGDELEGHGLAIDTIVNVIMAPRCGERDKKMSSPKRLAKIISQILLFSLFNYKIKNSLKNKRSSIAFLFYKIT